ncbi:hypothetical protein BC2230_80240 [Burkholderia cepacia]
MSMGVGMGDIVYPGRPRRAPFSDMWSVGFAPPNTGHLEHPGRRGMIARFGPANLHGTRYALDFKVIGKLDRARGSAVRS